MVYPPGNQVNVNASESAYVEPGVGPAYYARRVVSVLFGILAVLIALRILLLLFAANAGNAIVDFVYGATEPFVAPFRGMFSFDAVTPNGVSVFDVAALTSLVGWTLAYILIMAVLRISDRRAADAL